MATPEFAEKIDWQRPWLAWIKPLASEILAAPDWRVALNSCAVAAGLQNHRGLPLRFVPQADLPAKHAYEAFISATGGVPTRDNLHDFFNALMWLSFPEIKVQLNRMQAEEIQRSGNSTVGAAVRGNLRDAFTIFDENAVLLISSDADLVAKLRAHDWQAAFVDKRAQFGTACEVCLFGHALMDKLVQPYKAITGHAWVLIVESDYFSLPVPDRRKAIMHAVAAEIAVGFGTAAFTPLPISGVPGWWAGQDREFYADASVFRPVRVKKALPLSA